MLTRKRGPNTVKSLKNSCGRQFVFPLQNTTVTAATTSGRREDDLLCAFACTHHIHTHTRAHRHTHSKHALSHAHKNRENTKKLSTITTTKNVRERRFCNGERVERFVQSVFSNSGWHRRPVNYTTTLIII